jgi:hypothetical protein
LATETAALEMDIAVALPTVVEDAFDAARAATRGMGGALLVDAPTMDVMVRRCRTRATGSLMEGGWGCHWKLRRRLWFLVEHECRLRGAPELREAELPRTAGD